MTASRPSERSESTEPHRVPIRAKRRSAESKIRIHAFSNLKKVFWPAENYTKGDLIEYYRAVVAVDSAVSAGTVRS